MPLNRLALIRYRTIDQCLRNRARRWTLEDLIDACSDALYEYEGNERGVSRRTVQYDIQMMRSDKLGYEAPIIVQERKYYTYADPDYSIMRGPLTEADMGQLGDAVAVLKQFQGFGHMQELGGLVQKLEDKVTSARRRSRPAIMLDKNERLKGLEYLDELYRAVSQEKVVRLTYQSFRAKQPGLVIVHPYLLREYNNRWFLVGCKDQQENLSSFALDRIEGVTFPDVPYQARPDFDPEAYYQNVVGVTVMNRRAQEVRLWVDRRNAPYVLTKPLHDSQEVRTRHRDGSVELSIRVIPNFELERLLLGFGPSMKVLHPARLRGRMQRLLEEAVALYEKDA